MQLRPRHYVLIAVIIGIFAFNVWRHHTSAVVVPSSTPTVTTAPPVQSAAWSAFDHAAALRDAPDTDFQPALKDLRTLLDAAPTSGISGCLVWLEFYRQGMAQTRTDPQMKDRSLHHLDGCVKYHLETTA